MNRISVLFKGHGTCGNGMGSDGLKKNDISSNMEITGSNRIFLNFKKAGIFYVPGVLTFGILL